MGYFLGKRAIRRAIHKAHLDQLTGLPDRSLGLDGLRKAVRTHQSRTLALVDIDGLHDTNEEFGHHAGDELVSAVADQLRVLLLALPGGGLVSRVGGDEFLVVTPCTPAELEHAYVATLNGAASRASVGITQLCPGETAEHALGCADLAMYVAKQSDAEHTARYALTMGEPDKPTGLLRRARRGVRGD